MASVQTVTFGLCAAFAALGFAHTTLAADTSSAPALVPESSEYIGILAKYAGDAKLGGGRHVFSEKGDCATFSALLASNAKGVEAGAVLRATCLPDIALLGDVKLSEVDVTKAGGYSLECNRTLNPAVAASLADRADLFFGKIAPKITVAANEIWAICKQTAGVPLTPTLVLEDLSGPGGAYQPTKPAEVPPSVTF